MVTMADHASAVYAVVEGLASGEVHNGSDDACSRRNRHSDKIFLSRASRIRRLRIAADVEPRQAACAGDQKEEAGNSSKLRQLDVPSVLAISSTVGMR